MLGIRPAGQVLAAIALGIAGLIATTATGAQASGTTLCDFQTAPASGGLYTVQNDEWNSSAAECVTTSGGSNFAVANSTIDNPTDGNPGGYPSIYTGCHWGDCTTGSLATSPPPVAAIGLASVTSSWDITTPEGSGNVYDVAYDIWINRTPTTTVQADGTEIMVWLQDNGPIQPAGSVVASDVRIGAYSYDIWYSAGSDAASVVTYQMISPVSKVTDLNIGRFIRNAEQRGYTSSLWYLVSVEAGFEIWQGGTGLATASFSVNLRTGPRTGQSSGSGSTPPPGSQPYRTAGPLGRRTGPRPVGVA
jgi:hypothetical protein